MQLVDLALPFLVLDLPHPLFADDVDFSGVAGWSALVEVDDGAPAKDHHEDAQRDHRPGDFEDQRSFNLMGLAAMAATIFQPEYRNRSEDRRGERDSTPSPAKVGNYRTYA